jgi:hypothetical protein
MRRPGYFYDVRWRTGERVTDRPTLAAAAPLYFGLATPEQGRAVAARWARLPQARRLRHDDHRLGAAVGRAQRVAAAAVDGDAGGARYGRAGLADSARARWLALNRRTYLATGKMTEKYDVVDLNRPAGGGEYPTQDGFGWSNGVGLALWAQEAAAARLPVRKGRRRRSPDGAPASRGGSETQRARDGGPAPAGRRDAHPETPVLRVAAAPAVGRPHRARHAPQPSGDHESGPRQHRTSGAAEIAVAPRTVPGEHRQAADHQAQRREPAARRTGVEVPRHRHDELQHAGERRAA